MSYVVSPAIRDQNDFNRCVDERRKRRMAIIDSLTRREDEHHHHERFRA